MTLLQTFAKFSKHGFSQAIAPKIVQKHSAEHVKARQDQVVEVGEQVLGVGAKVLARLQVDHDGQEHTGCDENAADKVDGEAGQRIFLHVHDHKVLQEQGPCIRACRD